MLPQLLWAQAPPARLAPVSKLAPGLQAMANAPRLLRVRVADGAAFRHWARQHQPAAEVGPANADGRTLTVSGLTAAQLAAAPGVEFVDVADRRAHEERRLSNSDIAVNAISAVHARFPGLTGQGLTASVKEGAFDPEDIDLKGRAVNPAAFAKPASDHATAMATLLGGAGNSDVLGRGAARAVRLATSDFARLLPDDAAQLTQAGISVQNHSYGVGIENYYGLEAQAYDQQTRQLTELLHVFSSGNVGTSASPSGPYQGLAGYANLSGQFKMSKNTLTVGATDPSGQVATLSSRGPAYDGRLKPELVAYGEGGSSEAAALVSGTSILLQQQYRDQHAGALPPAALVKAVLLNSADDLGAAEVDYASGFGQLDALRAVNAMRAGQFFGGNATQGTDQVFRFTVPAGQQQLKATLVWSDPAAAANAATALVNDLDLELVAVGTGQRWLPWTLSAYPNADSLARPARRRPDHRNNAEQITLTLPAAGVYELHVRGYAVPQGPQAFSLAYEFSAPSLTWTRPVRPDNLRPGPATLRWQWSGPAGATARLDYRPVGRAGWRVVGSAVPLSDSKTTWAVPDTATLAQLRLVSGGNEFVTDTFSIARAPALQVGYACAEEALLQWPRIPGVARYQVYQLGAAYLEPLLQTTDTAVVLSRAQLPALYFAVAPVVGGRVGQPGATINYTTQGTACYFRSFLARQLIDETIRFDVVLGTVYRLQSATLERQRPDGSFAAEQTISPVSSPTFTFTDQPSAAGRYHYRVRLDNVAGQQFYSNVEEAFLLTAGQVQAYPNPVTAGQPLYLVANTTGPVTVQIYDLLGRIQRTVSIDGQINELDTSGLRPAMYLLRMQAQGQATQVIRMVVQ
ncbi:S8 family serine peptidase [Hymenobacter properus]|uniref:S8 family serine peptidase n=1 Tax=Hymenobacter properus TaxID=2791026 RepID=A0A931FJ34_9BACT|nr:S8 family serine peptidase [Hymenobacter properus]MBF9142602.1 S8 family serine peptidase [Hymenobacter properus]MBR7721410.1 S8 family serine peptidase [Microvirga sp. SRT04]